ncbi:putative selenate reductase subunit YgfK [Mediterraneibacter gnavus]|uniref:Selenate reductase subunit YgfK n=1 Tax=Mediterraneibacter gnavus TaxID=33038 RepID=A0AAW6K900_MEDGN|nr:putative selenate reductase subunit YgfK [Mediterraneibacter gnavus]MDB8698556.1 putative selenate reductase subunit YgfK [Mediterraneibacter gnavus]MDC6141141.1 putative selenate reductase subunit YgfK [Mediterraneibacter gnavus]MDE1204707.1 putative selenate reductase subunit YgfK [Mediterraneibacter gnavus]RHM34356.1 putative selenate reductase subunit YgfK [Mediterraneibacter gnavus]
MSEVMTPMSFEQLVEWVLQEKKKRGTVFGQHHAYRADGTHNRTMFGRTLETPIGPAAGPHTQMTQNIVAAYYAGSRFFELKTVQIMDGEELAACINRPCIKADDEGYNCEWSTELTVPQAMEEYIKAWFLLKVIAKEFGLGDMNGFQFNVSVGYDLAGIQSPKVDTFLNSMKHAEDTEIFKNCKAYLLEHADWFEYVTTEDIEQIPPEICNSVTLSTLHGCPPQEIERIAMYLLTEKGFHTFVKCNPTLLGYEFARKTMDEMGYDYIQFGDFHFKDDLQYEDAVPMLTRLMNTAKERNLEFGVKITNTFPVDVKQNELPSEEMYMSGKSLYPLSISLAAKLAKEFDGRLRISYSGGADYYNIERIVDAGIWPVTVATTLLKPGGYQRLTQMAKLLDKENAPFEKVDAESAGKLAEEAVKDPHHVKAMKPLPSRKMKKEVPLMDCFVAPCKEGCPIHQDITTYLQLVGEEKYEEAMEVITEKNPLPFITGTICAHNCMSKCTRNFYETPVHIREMKLKAAENGYEALLEKLPVPAVTKAGKAAVIGGGPAGMAAAYFLRKGGMEVTLFEAKESLGGVVRHVIPPFRISEDAIEKDAEILRKMQVDIHCNTKLESLEELKKQGYTKIVLAVGAPVQGSLKLESGMPKNALEFLAEFKQTDGKVSLGKHVVVIGGGNTAMDTARAAKRNAGVEHVYLIYRRTRRYMPADEEELVMALEDGVEFKELLSPVKLENGQLFCKVMQLSDYDVSGRRGVTETGETVWVPADTVIAAVGEKVPTDWYQANGLAVSEKGRLYVDEKTLKTSDDNVYAAGDGLYGPATVVEAIRDGRKVAEAIAGEVLACDFDKLAEEEKVYAKRGVLKEEQKETKEAGRCLGCSTICENCVEVCPNRANIAIQVPGMEKHQIIHVDYLCNECGNCKSFCPYSSAPYLDKFTLFETEADMENSKNQGFAVLDQETRRCKVRFFGKTFIWEPEKPAALPDGLGRMIETVCRDYSYLIR